MIDELLAYHNAELEYLRVMGAEFAERYPKVAARLPLEADKREDPHVERILEGVAFLTARIRRKIDDHVGGGRRRRPCRPSGRRGGRRSGRGCRRGGGSARPRGLPGP
jgi:Type VI secretion system, TssF